MDREEIFRIVEAQNVKFIRLQFTDILGVFKSISITVDQLGKALDGELMFDGSSIEGFVRIEESDMYLRPDLDTFLVLPWIAPTPPAGQPGLSAMFSIPTATPSRDVPVMP